ncbi:hypothetical protein Poli38472_009817 [Pythium oligandrum]|uniref:EGF-like domain-containing protein n=1 Tax=Pythium oligandrum TaxID=41045 RepID=A0A8K1FIQ3_PYTOL|nr:hypothetical protein Poli38472_009817 [Pythium oligandrum]|eukprot:TMW62324.1 hypothetical protein Poli38472_009817 [Pythium oligandrum]
MRVFLLGLVLLVVLSHVSEAACPRGMYNNKICSGYGSCNNLNQCVCDSRHTGFDCSQARCPRGRAWAAPAQATDDAHYEVECSNRGICHRETGMCHCMEGFTGTACQRLMCPNACSDAGECVSLLALSRLYAVGTEPLYDYAWDAEMIYGCNCRKGFHGYDCSKRSCPRGDDPLTTGQVNEVQIIRCTGRSGFFYVFFNGEGTTVRFDATESQFREALRSIKTLSSVKVTYTSGTTACNDVLDNAILIEFINEFGPQPAFKVFNGMNGQVTLQGGSIFATFGGAVLAGRVSVRGTKEWAFCSNRGDCDESTGQCACYILPMPGFRSSDGYGNPGIRGDCGCANNQNKYGGPIKACAGELACSGHGYCTGSPTFRCVCEAGWTTGDCSTKTCPRGPAWFAVPTATNTIHNQLAVCSNGGTCDRATGECQCFSPFSGTACDELKCPGEPLCNGHGQCMSIRQWSNEADVDDPAMRFDYGTDPNNAQTYDRDSIFGCKCDPGYEGYDCSQESCPLGDDPTTTGQADEIKVFQCLATGGSFQLQYRTTISADIPFNASPQQLRDILFSSFGLEDVLVEFSTGQSACSSAASTNKNVVKLTFTLNLGSLPPLRSITTNLISDAVAPTLPLTFAEKGAVLGGIVSRMGTKESAVCSNKGLCNHETGVCECIKGYGSSDGRGKPGQRRDCGYILPKFKIDG